MSADKYINYTASDFLKDRDFLRWRLVDHEEDRQFWNDVVEKHPPLRASIEEAITLYNSNIRFNDFSISDSEVSERSISLLGRVNREKKKRTRKRIAITASAIAAAIAVAVSVSLLFEKKIEGSAISTFAQSLADNGDFYSSDVRLVVSEGNTVLLKNTESSIEYDAGAIKADENIISKAESAPYNRLIVPYGKRSIITFSDGTKAWVNAGSRLVYPTEFDISAREIHVDGEIYIEVAPDRERPFVIRTKRMDIEVLGTKFNVSAHEADNRNSVALLSGSVIVSPNGSGEPVILKPDQMFLEVDGSQTVENVDAKMHILWTEGLYHFESVRLDNILTRLERYYGVRIECDNAIAGRRCSGKLNLKDDVTELLDELSKALSVTYGKKSDGSYRMNAVD